MSPFRYRIWQLMTMVMVSVWTARQTMTASPQPLAAIEGEYVAGSGHYGTVLTLHKSGRFDFTTYQDIIGVKPRTNQGTATLSGNSLTLKPKQPIRPKESWETLNTEYLVVRWGKRLYLVPTAKDGIINFCNAINLGFEPRTFPAGWPYLKASDAKVKVRGYPSLPNKWQGYLVRKPITGSVISVRLTTKTGADPYDPHGPSVRIAVATVNAGRKAGLRPGMRLDVKPPSGSPLLEVVKVSADKCTVEFPVFAGTVLLKVGDRVSTRRLR
jgi:hypothetical protein